MFAFPLVIFEWKTFFNVSFSGLATDSQIKNLQISQNTQKNESPLFIKLFPSYKTVSEWLVKIQLKIYCGKLYAKKAQFKYF